MINMNLLEGGIRNRNEEDENAEEIKYKHFTKDEILYYLRTTD